MTWEWAFIIVSWSICGVYLYVTHLRNNIAGLQVELDERFRGVWDSIHNKAYLAEIMTKDEASALGLRISAIEEKLDPIEKTATEAKKMMSEQNLAMGFPQFKTRAQRAQG